MKNTLLSLFGYHKCGASDKPDTRDYLAENVPEEQTEMSKRGMSLPAGLLSTNTKNQGRGNDCTSQAISKVIEIMLTGRLKKFIFVDPRQIWEKQLETGASNENGDTLQNALKQVKKHGVKFLDYGTDGVGVLRTVTFEGYARVLPEDFDKWTAKGHAIYTGCEVHGNFINKYSEITFKGKSRGGHAWAIISKLMFSEGYRGENSWGGVWGLDGTMLLKKEDTSRLFSSYVLYGMKIN